MITNIKNYKKVRRILNLDITEESNVLILGDHDCDGITSSAILKYVLPDAHVELTSYDTGHGWSKKLITSRVNIDEFTHIVILDSGIENLSVEWLGSLEAKIIIIDHHRWDIPDNLPTNITILNAVHSNDEYIGYCTAMLVGSLFEYEDLYLIKFLMAVGTVGDEQEFVELNWKIVRDIIDDIEYSRTKVARKLSPNIAVTIERFYRYSTALDLLIHISTVINTISRLGDQKQALNFCISRLPLTKPATMYLDERKRLLENIKLTEVYTEGLIDVVQVDDIPSSFVSYIATREVFKRNKPIVVYHKDNNFGSARSPKNINIRETLNEVKNLEAKGHNSACGVKVINNESLCNEIKKITHLVEETNKSEIQNKNQLYKEFDMSKLNEYWDLRPLKVVFKTEELTTYHFPMIYELSKNFYRIKGISKLEIQSFKNSVPKEVALEFSTYNNKFILKEV